MRRMHRGEAQWQCEMPGGEKVQGIKSVCPIAAGPIAPCDTLATATPRVTGRKRGPVPKRRYQQGCFWLKGGMAYTFYYEDCEQPDGTLKTRKVRHFIGRVPDEFSDRVARREHDRIMQEVNRKRGSVA